VGSGVRLATTRGLRGQAASDAQRHAVVKV